ncbi:MAG TPA: hypothetical protein PLB49_14350 [Chitinophagaceae bacterium]|nr:hypothetical protein [Chitinophagaceae bacterium]
MEPDFMLPVSFDEKDIELPVKVVQFGYVVKLEVEIEGTIVTFEPDEERNWRAVLGFEDLIAGKKVKKELLEAVASVIGDITK